MSKNKEIVTEIELSEQKLKKMLKHRRRVLSERSTTVKLVELGYEINRKS